MAAKKSSATKSLPKSAKQVPSPKGRLTKSAKTTTEENAGDKEVTLDRRRGPRRAPGEAESTQVALERRTKVQRRRQIDPTTCERDYSEEEVAFMNAMDEYKRKSGRMFPTCSEVLEVIRDLGYVKLTPAELALVRPQETTSPEPECFEIAETESDDMEFDTL